MNAPTHIDVQMPHHPRPPATKPRLDLIHITPRIIVEPGVDVEILDVTIEQLGLSLRGNTHLRTSRPFPNADTVSACRISAEKDQAGIFITQCGPCDQFQVISRWRVEGQIHQHRVNYFVLDADYDAISDDMVIWGAMSNRLGGWHNRWPEDMQPQTPLIRRPRMERRRNLDALPHPHRRALDILDGQGRLLERVESVFMPTLEHPRVANSLIAYSPPSLDMAFERATLPPAELHDFVDFEALELALP